MAIKNPFNMTLDDIGEQEVPLDEPYEMMEVRKYIRLVLEDAYSFTKDGAKLQKAGHIVSTFRDEILPMEKSLIGRNMKRLFAKHADRDFLNNLNTVHWTGDEYALKF